MDLKITLTKEGVHPTIDIYKKENDVWVQINKKITEDMIQQNREIKLFLKHLEIIMNNEVI